MGRQKGVQGVVIVEDKQLERLVRRTREAFRFNSQKVRVRPDYSKGKSGDARRYVNDTYAKEAFTFRQKGRENRALLVGTEADQVTVSQRKQKLESIVDPARSSEERIVYWIPKWHVETWGCHFMGNAVDESAKYKNRAREIDWKQAGAAFENEYDRSNTGAVETFDSLRAAYAETRRLEK